MKSRILASLVALTLLVSAAVVPDLQSVWLDWTEPENPTGLKGYNLYLGEREFELHGPILLYGAATSQRVLNNHPTTWAVVRARYTDHESEPTNEISFTINDK